MKRQLELSALLLMGCAMSGCGANATTHAPPRPALRASETQKATRPPDPRLPANRPANRADPLKVYAQAEDLNSSNQWTQAARAYTRVVQLEPLEEKVLKQAAQKAVIAWRNALAVAPPQFSSKAPSRSPRSSFASRPIPALLREMILAQDNFIKHLRDSPELVPVKYRRARAYYEYDHFKIAAEGFAEIVTRHAGHQLAVHSANLLLDIFNLQKKYKELEQWVERLMKIPALARGEFRRQLIRMHVNIQWKRAEDLQGAHNYKDSGEAFWRLAQAYPDIPRWPKLVYNAAICFEAAKMVQRAIALRKRLIAKTPNHSLAIPALYMVAENYLGLGQPRAAADHFEAFGKKFGGEREAPLALRKAFAIRLHQKQQKEAMADARLFAKSYARWRKYRRQAAEMNFALGAFFEEQKNAARAIKHYREYLARWKAAGGVSRQIRAHVKIGLALREQSCQGRRSRTKARMASSHFATAIALHQRVSRRDINRQTQEQAEQLRQTQKYLASAKALQRATMGPGWCDVP